jgi:uncharacterized protein YraI
MPVKNKRILFAIIFIVLAALACNAPGNAPATENATGEEITVTPSFTPIPVIASETATPTIAAEACVPTVTTSVVANIRNGPGQVYPILGTLPQGGKATVAGKSYDGTWWYIEFAGGTGGYAWIATSVTNAECIPSTLASIAAPPAPEVSNSDDNSNNSNNSSNDSEEVSDQPSATPTTTSGGIILLPPIFFIKSPTPTPPKIIIFPPPILINP